MAVGDENQGFYDRLRDLIPSRGNDDFGDVYDAYQEWQRNSSVGGRGVRANEAREEFMRELGDFYGIDNDDLAELYVQGLTGGLHNMKDVLNGDIEDKEELRQELDELLK